MVGNYCGEVWCGSMMGNNGGELCGEVWWGSIEGTYVGSRKKKSYFTDFFWIGATIRIG